MKIFILPLVCFFLLFSYLPTTAQTPQIDSLQRILPTLPASRQAQVYLALAQNFLIVAPDNVLAYLQKAENLASQYTQIDTQIEVLDTWGLFYHKKNELGKANTAYTQAITALQNTNNHVLYAQVYTHTAKLYITEGKYSQAITLYQQILTRKKNGQDYKGIASVMIDMGKLYVRSRDIALAFDYYKQAGEALKNLPASYPYLEGLIETGLGECYLDMGEHIEALTHYQKATHWFQQVTEPQNLGAAFLNLGYAYSNFGQNDKAIASHLKSIEAFEKTHDDMGLTYPLTALSNLYTHTKKDYNKAKPYALRALKITQDMDLPAEAREAYAVLAFIYEHQEKYQEALYHHQKHIAIRDELVNTGRVREIAQLETKFQVNAKQSEIDLLAKDKLLLDKENNLIKAEKESQRLYALAERETNSRKADSLTNLAQKAQLKEQKTEAEAKAQQAIKDKTVAQQQNILYILAIAIVLGTAILGLIARSRQMQKKANRVLQIQNVEIQQQKEEIQVQSESLHQLNQWKDKIFAVIAHDLRNPLTAMQGVGKQIEFYLGRNKLDKIQQIGTVVEKNTQHITHILDNLLHWAMLQTKQITLFPKEIKPYNVVRSLTVGESLVQNLIAPDFIVQADETALAVILRNLIGNALKFTPEGGSIKVKAIREAGKVFISVTNTGEGIAPEKIATLFTQKVISQESNTGEKGVGIGLMLCSAFAQKMGAELTVSSTVGKETTFTLILQDNAFLVL